MVCVVLTGTPKYGRGEQRDRAGGFRGEAAHRLQARDLRTHGVDDAPAPRQRAQRDRRVGRHLHPERDRELLHVAAGEERAGDDAHRLLRVVRTVAQAVERRRQQLQFAEVAIDPRRRRPLAQIQNEHHHQHEASDEPDPRRQHDEDQGLGPAGRNERDLPDLGDRRAGVGADDRVRRTGRQARSTR